jgi:hypothetical protein
MDEAAFWEMVSRAAQAGPATRDRVRALTAQLEACTPDELQAFDRMAWGWFLALDRKELWAAAYVLMGGASDDGFCYFREWLVLQGREVVLRAVHDPDSLADLPLFERTRTEDLLSLAKEAYEARLHQEMPDTPTVRVDRSAWPPDRVKDYDWTEEDTDALFPRLTAREPWRVWLGASRSR